MQYHRQHQEETAEKFFSDDVVLLIQSMSLTRSIYLPHVKDEIPERLTLSPEKWKLVSVRISELADQLMLPAFLRSTPLLGPAALVAFVVSKRMREIYDIIQVIFFLSFLVTAVCLGVRDLQVHNKITTVCTQELAPLVEQEEYYLEAMWDLGTDRLLRFRPMLNEVGVRSPKPMNASIPKWALALEGVGIFLFLSMALPT
jgi:hypothetical protein